MSNDKRLSKILYVLLKKYNGMTKITNMKTCPMWKYAYATLSRKMKIQMLSYSVFHTRRHKHTHTHTCMYTHEQNRFFPTV